MTTLQNSLTLCLAMLIAAASGCACCPMKGPGCCADVGCCDAPCGSSMAFQKYDGCCKQDIPVCVCTGDCGCDLECGCDVGCGCEPECCAEPACDLGCCDDACGCGDCCGPVSPCLHGLKHALGKLLGGVCGCSGCDGEVYWNEWHNDPPRCCDPCDKCGNWVGPSQGYRAPYTTPCGCQ